MTLSTQTTQVPRIGDKVYIPTAGHLSRGVDDRLGGKATVSNVQLILGSNFIYFHEFPGVSMRWEDNLAEKQEALAKEFGDGLARKDPDHSPEFNTGRL